MVRGQLGLFSRPLRVLDLFAGRGGWSAPFVDAGDDVVTVDLDPSFGTTIVADILALSPADVPGPWDVVLASPPCEKFSPLRLIHNWAPGGEPRNDAAVQAVELVAATLALIRELAPRAWVLENPRGKLRALPVVAGLERRTVTYCRLGLPYPKPTDLWGGFPRGLVLPPPCTKDDPCGLDHPSRTTLTASGGKLWQGAVTRSGGAQFWSNDPRRAEARATFAMVPIALGQLVRDAVLTSEPVALPPPIIGLYQLGAGWFPGDA